LPPGATVDVRDRYAEKSVLWPKLVVAAFFIWWAYAILDDTGVLFRLTRNWRVPLGHSREAEAGSKSDQTNSVPGAGNPAPPAAK